jgi:hypothetical protein
LSDGDAGRESSDDDEVIDNSRSRAKWSSDEHSPASVDGGGHEPTQLSGEDEAFADESGRTEAVASRKASGDDDASEQSGSWANESPGGSDAKGQGAFIPGKGGADQGRVPGVLRANMWSDEEDEPAKPGSQQLFLSDD